jgi:tRNA-specific adenosine deaminase 2
MRKDFMEAALAYAQEALDSGEVPVGCVFVKNEKIVASGRNQSNELMDATMHAEFLAMKQLEDISLTKELDLYVTVEPCLMCAAALRQVGVMHVYYGAANEKFGGCGSVFSLHLGYILSANERSSPFPEYSVTGGILAEEAIIMLRQFYIRENDHAPNPRKKTNRLLKLF